MFSKAAGLDGLRFEAMARLISDAGRVKHRLLELGADEISLSSLSMVHMYGSARLAEAVRLSRGSQDDANMGPVSGGVAVQYNNAVPKPGQAWSGNGSGSGAAEREPVGAGSGKGSNGNGKSSSSYIFWSPIHKASA